MERVYKIWSKLEFILILASLVGFVISSFLKMEFLASAFFWGLVGLLVLSVTLEKFIVENALKRKYSLPVYSLKAVIDELSEDSVLYKWGLRMGDVVVRVNGDELENTFLFDNWWQDNDSVTLAVLRDNQELQITVKKE